MKFREIMTCFKLQVPTINYGEFLFCSECQIKKSSVSKINVACPELTSFHYIMKPGIFGTQTYS